MSGRPTPAAARPDSLVPAPPGLPALLKRFPPRALELSWAATRQDREAVLGRLLAPPFTVDSAANQEGREAGVVKVLDWLTGQPGATWQEKWLASGAEQAGNTEWRQLASRHLRGHERTGSASRAEFIQLGRGLLPLLGADIVRPSLTWLLTPGSIKYLVPEMARSRDRAGFTRLEELAAKDPANTSTKGAALRRIRPAGGPGRHAH